MFSPYKKTLTGLPVRNIDYGTLYAKDPSRDVKRSLEPEFLATLDSMCNSGTMQTTSTPNKSTSQNVSNPSNNLSGISNHGNNDSRTLGSHGNNGSKREGSPLHGMIRDVHCCVKCGVSPCCCKLFCGVCRTDNSLDRANLDRERDNMSRLSNYQKDGQCDLVMGGVISRIDHLIERLGKGSYDKPKDSVKPNNPDVGIILPCEACAIRSVKRFNHIACQTDEPLLAEEEEEVEVTQEEGPEDEAKSTLSPKKGLSRSASVQSVNSVKSTGTNVESHTQTESEPTLDGTAAATSEPQDCGDFSKVDEPGMSSGDSYQGNENAFLLSASPSLEVLTISGSPNIEISSGSKAESLKIPSKILKKSFSSLSGSIASLEGVYTETEEDDNISVLSSDDELDFTTVDSSNIEVPEEVREYQIAQKALQSNSEIGSTETVHFQMLPYRNLYVWGSRKFTGSLPARIATKANYNLNYHIKIFKGLNSDRTDIRMKKLKEICSNKSVPNKKRNLDSSKLGNVLVVDIARYSKQLKRSATDRRIPVINMRDGYCNKYWLSERVSDTMMSRSPRLRFAIELAKSNRCHWKLKAKDLLNNQRPYTYQSLYGGRAYQQFYLAEMKRFVTKPLLSRCLLYYADIFEGNTKDGVSSKGYIGCLGNQNAKDSKSTPIVNFEDRLKEHLRAGQKLFDPKIHIFNVALQNPGLALDEAGRLLAAKGTSEITKCPMLLFVPLDFGFSSWSKPTTQDHLSALRQSYVDIFCCNSPAGYNV